MNRRTFVTSLAAAGAAIATTSKLFSADTAARPKVGLIGCGWFGGVDLESLVRQAEANVVSLCDVNANALKSTLPMVAKFQSTAPKTFVDYREMLDAGGHDIVIVATPDHWHALAAIAAMKAGADVWLEKPVSIDVLEGEALVAAARKYQRVVQVNTQRRSNPWGLDVREKYVRSGKLGAIGLVETYSYLAARPADMPPDGEAPKHLDYEKWTGPAPLLPYKAGIESQRWRSMMEYGNGQIGDLGVHVFDQVRWMLGLGWPESIRSTGGIYVDTKSSANISDTQRSVFHYRNLDVSWEHRTWGVSPIPERHWTDQWGARFIGKNGTLNVTMLGYDFTPAGGGPREGFHMCSKTGNLENLDFTTWGAAAGEIQRLHVMDFTAARERRSPPVADIAEGHISTSCCILANLALELGRTLSYDPKTRTIPGDADATRRLARAYRAPWVHPDPASV
jgi:predicted dehydrogenase